MVDARIGCLRGIDAVYYALTLPNANFEFSGSTEATERTINQPWTQVVLEGLRRLDEGLTPADAFPPGYVPRMDKPEVDDVKKTPEPRRHEFHVPAFLSFANPESIAKRKPLIASAVILAVLASAGAIGVPAGWYKRAKVVAIRSETDNATQSLSEASPATSADAEKTDAADMSADDAAALAARRLEKRDRARARDARAARVNQSSSDATSVSAKSGLKKVAVKVTYDETGRVTQASGGDASALRIARQKRFPAGKAGSATVTIPVN